MEKMSDEKQLATLVHAASRNWPGMFFWEERGQDYYARYLQPLWDYDKDHPGATGSDGAARPDEPCYDCGEKHPPCACYCPDEWTEEVGRKIKTLKARVRTLEEDLAGSREATDAAIHLWNKDVAALREKEAENLMLLKAINTPPPQIAELEGDLKQLKFREEKHLRRWYEVKQEADALRAALDEIEGILKAPGHIPSERVHRISDVFIRLSAPAGADGAMGTASGEAASTESAHPVMPDRGPPSMVCPACGAGATCFNCRDAPKPDREPCRAMTPGEAAAYIRGLEANEEPAPACPGIGDPRGHCLPCPELGHHAPDYLPCPRETHCRDCPRQEGN